MADRERPSKTIYFVKKNKKFLAVINYKILGKIFILLLICHRFRTCAIIIISSSHVNKQTNHKKTKNSTCLVLYRN